MKRKLHFISTLMVISFILAACNPGISFPPVSKIPTNTYFQGKFIWHDLATYNPRAAQTFYSKVFGWEFETLGSGDNTYYVVKNNDVPIGGMFKLADKYGKVAEWISSVSVPDLDAAVTYNTTTGGKTVFKKASFSGRGETALVQDPQGAFIAFLKAEGGDPVATRPVLIATNSWLWNELWTNDLDASMDYYKGLLNYSADEVPGSKAPYFLFSNGGNVYSGVLGNPVEGARSSWMPYIKVKNVKETYDKAIAAGAKSMLEPMSSVRMGTVAVLLDPTGAQFTIQQWITE